MNTSAVNAFHGESAGAQPVGRSSLIVRSLAVAGGCSALLVLIGWSADLPALESLWTGSIPIRPGMALCFLLLASSLLVGSVDQSSVRSGLSRDVTTLGTATAAAVIAALMLVLDWSGLDVDGGTVGSTAREGHELLGPLAALGLAAVVAGIRRYPKRFYWALTALAAFAAAATLCAQLVCVPLAPSVTPATTVLCALFAVAACLARTSDGLGRLVQSNGLGGALARPLFPATVLLPTLTAWVSARVLGVKDLGSALVLTELTMGITVALFGAVWVIAHRIDREGTKAGDRIARLARIADATSNAVIITDRSGVIEWVNGGFIDMTGYAFEEAVGRSPGRLLQGADTDADEVRRIGAGIRAGQTIDCELVNYTKRGKAYRNTMKIEPLRGQDGVIDGFMSIQSDVTEHFERNRALDLLTSRFNLATRTAGIGVFDHHVESGELWWSEVMYEIFAQPIGGFKPTLEAWRALIHPEDQPRVRRLGDAALVAQSALEIRYRIVRPDGNVRHVQSIGSFPHASPGLRSRRIGVLLDVTDRIDAERRERVLEVQLRESYHQAGLAETANGVLQSVEQALSGVGLAASTMRRDLTALRPERVEQVAQLIANNRADIATFLAEDVRGKYLPDFLLAIAGQIKGNAQNLDSELGQIEAFIHHLRDVITAQQSLIPMGGTIEPTDLRDLVEVALLVQAPDFARIDVVREYQDLPLMLTDRHKLLQIVVCFVSNARDALLMGGLAPPRVVVRVFRDADDAVFAIEDSGPGMSSDTLSHLWEFGFTTKRNGHGFGLHASALAAREIGARVFAESDGPGRGARFTVRLPLGGAPRVN
jgi:PAS domain S-box-containing protein